MSSSNIGTWTLLSIYLVCVRCTDSAQVTMTSGNAVLGKSVIINCSASFQTWETDRQIQINTSQLGVHFDWTEVNNESSSQWEKTGERYTVDIDTPKSDMIVMSVRVDDLVCPDGGTYQCTVVAGHQNSSHTVEVKHQLQLKLQVPPSAPGDLQITPESNVVKENEWFDIQCSVLTGQDNNSSLQWKIYRGQYVETVPRRDARIILEGAYNMSGEDFCRQQIVSKLRLTVTRRDQDCYVACFLLKPVNKQPSSAYCNHTELELCAKTPEFGIHYGVSGDNMQLYILPESSVTEGSNISIVCHADGHPPANYTWYRSKPPWLRNKTVPNRQVGNAGWLSISSFHSDRDAGTYKCTAWNWVMGTEYYSASQEISVSTGVIGKSEQVKLLDAKFLENLNSKQLIMVTAIVCIIIVLIIIAINVIVMYCARNKCGRRKRKSRELRDSISRRSSVTEREDSGSSRTSSVSGSLSDASVHR